MRFHVNGSQNFVHITRISALVWTDVGNIRFKTKMWRNRIRFKKWIRVRNRSSLQRNYIKADKLKIILVASVHRWHFRLQPFRKLRLLYKLRDTVCGLKTQIQSQQKMRRLQFIKQQQQILKSIMNTKRRLCRRKIISLINTQRLLCSRKQIPKMNHLSKKLYTMILL